MIGKNIGLNRRRFRRAANKALRKRGLACKVETVEKIRGRAFALTAYAYDADPQRLKAAGLAEEKSHARLTYIVDVAASFDELEKIEPGEKVDLVGFVNLPGDDFARCQREMIATVMRAPGADPLEHYVLAWQSHEQPRPEQVHRAAEIFLEVMGLSENQAIYAAHSNTENYHLHIVVNRVHPRTFERVEAGGAWQVDTIHQALALIEYEQGWASEPNALYRADDRGVFHNATNIHVRDANGPTGKYPTREQRAAERERTAAEKEKLPIEEQLSEGARAFEKRTRLQSFERVAKTIVRKHLRESRSWPELHQRLADEGFQYELGASGARIRWGERTLAASEADRSGALKQMERRKGFGPFEPAASDLRIKARAPTGLNGDDRIARFWEARRTYFAQFDAAKQELRSQMEAVREQLLGTYDCMIADINETRWVGSGAGLQIARAVVSHEYRRTEQAVRASFGAALARLNQAQVFPTLDEWLSGASAPEPTGVAEVRWPAILVSPGYGSAPLPATLGDFSCIKAGRAYHHLDFTGEVAVRDLGDLVCVDKLDREAVRLALVLAKEKWGTVRIASGDAAFRRLCAEVAAEEDVRFDDPNMMRFVDAARQRIEAPSARSYDAEEKRSDAAQKPGLGVDPLPRRTEERQVSGDRSPSPRSRQQPDTSAAQPPLRAIADFLGLDPLVDEWLAEHKRDPQNFAKLRPLAARVMQKEQARAVVLQLEAQGLVEAQRIKQQASFHLRQLASMQAAGMQR